MASFTSVSPNIIEYQTTKYNRVVKLYFWHVNLKVKVGLKNLSVGKHWGLGRFFRLVAMVKHSKASLWDETDKKEKQKQSRSESEGGGNTLENVERATGEGGIDETKRTINCQRAVWT